LRFAKPSRNADFLCRLQADSLHQLKLMNGEVIGINTSIYSRGGGHL
jgi:hypothetical protein